MGEQHHISNKTVRQKDRGEDSKKLCFFREGMEEWVSNTQDWLTFTGFLIKANLKEVVRHCTFLKPVWTQGANVENVTEGAD